MVYTLYGGLSKIIKEYPSIRDYSKIRTKEPNDAKEQVRDNYIDFLHDFNDSIKEISQRLMGKSYDISYSNLDRSPNDVAYYIIKLPNREEYHVVYLFEPNGEGVYLSLGLSVNPFKTKRTFSKSDIRSIKNLTDEFRKYITENNQEYIDNRNDAFGYNIDLGNKSLSKAYCVGTIFSKFYEFKGKDFNSLNEELEADLEKYLDLYDIANEYIDTFDKLKNESIPFEEENPIEENNHKEKNPHEKNTPPLDICLNANEMSDFLIEEDTLNIISASLNAGQNIILNGVPGTGKTYLANIFAEEAMGRNGYILTTATSDWTTFDTIGGLMPNKNGELKFREGKFLQAIRENKWLIIDEINRADIDKSFGQLFTVLSKKDVELPYYVNNNPIKIKLSDECNSCYDANNGTYYIGKNWRIIATMNSYDKNSLFDLSYAFMRRFMFIEIEVPKTFDDLLKIWNTEKLKDVSSDDDYITKLTSLYTNINDNEEINRQIGPAIFLDIIKYIHHRLKLENKPDENQNKILSEAINAYVIPQFEGLNREQIDLTINIFEKSVFNNKEDSELVVKKLNNLKSYY